MRNIFDIDTLREIGDSLFRNKSRSLLTGFGIFWGLFMLLFMVGGGTGLKQILTSNFAGFSSNAFIVFSQETSLPYKGFKEGRSWNLTADDVDYLGRMIPQLTYVSPIFSQWGSTAEYKSHTSNVVVKGVAGGYENVEAPHIKYGRYLSYTDVSQCRKVCVIGKEVYETLFPDGGDPCGTFIMVKSAYLQVIGVDYSTGNFNINGSNSRAVVMPSSTFIKLYNRGNYIDALVATTGSGISTSFIEPRMRSVLAHRHLINPEDNEALGILNTGQIFAIVDTLFRGLDFLIWLVGLGTLLAGVIGVSNIMMVTVRERTVEIGIRRAIGATPFRILSQIISESVALTLAAGSFGIVFSVLMLNVVEIATKHQAVFQINFYTALVAVMMLSVLGAVAGLAPASRAMHIKPVDAMRDE